MRSQRLPRVVIVGRPNVGKSTLFNLLVGKRVAVVEETPGVTRDRLHQTAHWEGRTFEVVDTGGIVFGDEDPLQEQIQLQAEIAIQDADVILLVTDIREGRMPLDEQLADALRVIQKPVIVVANKADHPSHDAGAGEFYALGFPDVFPISAVHKRNIQDLMERILQAIPSVEAPEEEETPPRIAIIGRPNVGKSSLVNAFLGSQRVIVSDIPGTTRDAVDTELEFEGQSLILVDTAGIRRPGKVQGSVDFYALSRAKRALERSDIALIVISGPEGLTHQDKTIAKMAHKVSKGCVFVVNKWDQVEPPDGLPRERTPKKREFAEQFRKGFPEMDYAPLCFASALHRTGIEPILTTCLEVLENSYQRIPTGTLNDWIQEATYKRPLTRKGKPIKIYYATQAEAGPPRFVLFCNEPSLMPTSYLRYLENFLRTKRAFEGVPIHLVLRQRERSSKR
jgi:GTP-binding protein